MYHQRPALDEEGEELPNGQAAWREATMTAGQIITTSGVEWRMEVTDAFTNRLYVIKLHVEKFQV